MECIKFYNKNSLGSMNLLLLLVSGGCSDEYFMGQQTAERQRLGPDPPIGHNTLSAPL